MQLKSGEKLELLIGGGEGKEPVVMSSKLENIGKNERYLISVPYFNGRMCPLPDGQAFVVRIQEKSAILSFDAKILGRSYRSGSISLLIQQEGEMRRIQRREDFRMETMLDGIIEFTDPESGSPKKARMRTVDISAGGTSIRAAVEFNIGDKITAYLPLSGGQAKTPFPCIVRRCFKLEQAMAGYQYNIGLQFVFDSDKEKEEMVQMVFKLDRDRKKSAGRGRF